MKIIIASYKCCKRISHLSFQVNRTVDQDFLINFPPTYPIIKHRFKYKLFIKLNQHLWIWISKASLNLPSLKYHKWMLSLFWHKECSTFVFLVMICQVIIFRLRFWILSQLDQIFFFFPPQTWEIKVVTFIFFIHCDSPLWHCDIHFLLSSFPLFRKQDYRFQGVYLYFYFLIGITQRLQIVIDYDLQRSCSANFWPFLCLREKTESTEQIQTNTFSWGVGGVTAKQTSHSSEVINIIFCHKITYAFKNDPSPAVLLTNLSCSYTHEREVKKSQCFN